MPQRLRVHRIVILRFRNYEALQFFLKYRSKNSEVHDLTFRNLPTTLTNTTVSIAFGNYELD